MDGYNEIFPDDSASQTGNLAERNERYREEFNENPIRRHETEEDINPTLKEDETTIASRVRDNVRSYLEIENNIKRLLAKSRELRKEKKTLQNKIIGDMRSLDIENLELKKGKLVAKKSNPKVPLTKSSITSILSKNFADKDFITNIVSLLYDKRVRTEKVELTHYRSNK